MKNNISATVIADSRNEFGNRITTMIVTMPRYILAEFNTHRMFSRNSASSRAIPLAKMIESIRNSPFIPIAWMKDHKGMQGTEYLSDLHIDAAVDNWIAARRIAIQQAEYLNKIGVTKQLCNRLLEPFMWHTVIVTATEWENFFALRCPNYTFPTGKGEVSYRSRKDALKGYTLSTNFEYLRDDSSYLEWAKYNRGAADIHMMATAEAMWDAYNESVPKDLKAGEWHIPFGDQMDEEKLKEFYMSDDYVAGDIDAKETGRISLRIKVATARCARVSYTVPDPVEREKALMAKPFEFDIKLHDRLAASGHWSPFEHCAKAMSQIEMRNWIHTTYQPTDNIETGWSGNFRGFVQYRKTFKNENIT